MKFIQWLWSDQETMKPVGGPVFLSDIQAQKQYERMVFPGSSTDCCFLIFNKEKAPVGEIGFHRLNQDNMTAEFNIKIASTERGKGYAGKAITLFLITSSITLKDILSLIILHQIIKQDNKSFFTWASSTIQAPKVFSER